MIGGVGHRAAWSEGIADGTWLVAVNCPAALPGPSPPILQWISFKHELGEKQLRFLNREIKGENDHPQEADENLLQGDLGKEEHQTCKHVILLSLQEITDGISSL